MFITHISDKGLTSRIHKELLHINNENMSNPTENGQKRSTHFSREDRVNKCMNHISEPLVIWEMPIMLIKHNELPFYTQENGCN